MRNPDHELLDWVTFDSGELAVTGEYMKRFCQPEARGWAPQDVSQYIAALTAAVEERDYMHLFRENEQPVK